MSLKQTCKDVFSELKQVPQTYRDILSSINAVVDVIVVVVNVAVNYVCVHNLIVVIVILDVASLD